HYDPDIFDQVAQVYHQLGLNDKAYYYERHSRLRADSLRSQEAQQRITLLKELFESEQNQQKIAQLQAQRALQEDRQWFLVTI
ncbi:hypothetical protein, partial [Staphylococcus aureus]|uniref:hypothetical protein n=1 Tax=Staphylococcus aureus TaxID=1280 RepID=UPI001BFD7914